jgi:hypothetical protein
MLASRVAAIHLCKTFTKLSYEHLAIIFAVVVKVIVIKFPHSAINVPLS